MCLLWFRCGCFLSILSSVHFWTISFYTNSVLEPCNASEGVLWLHTTSNAFAHQSQDLFQNSGALKYRKMPSDSQLFKMVCRLSAFSPQPEVGTSPRQCCNFTSTSAECGVLFVDFLPIRALLLTKLTLLTALFLFEVGSSFNRARQKP